jgi:hypothetical protein
VRSFEVEIDLCGVYLTPERDEVLEKAAKAVNAPGCMSNSRRVAPLSMRSKAGRLSRSFAPLMAWSLYA